MRDLNVALQEAKLRGPNSAKAWEPALTSSVGRRLALLDELRRALDENEFVLHYQPIVSLADQRVVGAEALLRWNHPTEGIMPPKDFLPLLEESGLIVAGRLLGHPRGRAADAGLADAVRPRDARLGQHQRVGAAVQRPLAAARDTSEINDSGFPLDRLKLEITESAVMRSPEVTRTVLGELQDIGIRVALDDFGTGYSALGALRHYSVDTIKIDRDFTKRLDTDDGRELVLALLRIARIYGAAVVAEGVETSAQEQTLQRRRLRFRAGLPVRQADGRQPVRRLCLDPPRRGRRPRRRRGRLSRGVNTPVRYKAARCARPSACGNPRPVPRRACGRRRRPRTARRG